MDENLDKKYDLSEQEKIWIELNIQKINTYLKQLDETELIFSNNKLFERHNPLLNTIRSLIEALNDLIFLKYENSNHETIKKFFNNYLFEGKSRSETISFQNNQTHHIYIKKNCELLNLKKQLNFGSHSATNHFQEEHIDASSLSEIHVILIKKIREMNEWFIDQINVKIEEKWKFRYQDEEEKFSQNNSSKEAKDQINFTNNQIEEFIRKEFFYFDLIENNSLLIKRKFIQFLTNFNQNEFAKKINDLIFKISNIWRNNLLIFHLNNAEKFQNQIWILKHWKYFDFLENDHKLSWLGINSDLIYSLSNKILSFNLIDNEIIDEIKKRINNNFIEIKSPYSEKFNINNLNFNLKYFEKTFNINEYSDIYEWATINLMDMYKWELTRKHRYNLDSKKINHFINKIYLENIESYSFKKNLESYSFKKIDEYLFFDYDSISEKFNLSQLYEFEFVEIIYIYMGIYTNFYTNESMHKYGGIEIYLNINWIDYSLNLNKYNQKFYYLFIIPFHQKLKNLFKLENEILNNFLNLLWISFQKIWDKWKNRNIDFLVDDFKIEKRKININELIKNEVNSFINSFSYSSKKSLEELEKSSITFTNPLFLFDSNELKKDDEKSNIFSKKYWNDKKKMFLSKEKDFYSLALSNYGEFHFWGKKEVEENYIEIETLESLDEENWIIQLLNQKVDYDWKEIEENETFMSRNEYKLYLYNKFILKTKNCINLVINSIDELEIRLNSIYNKDYSFKNKKFEDKINKKYDEEDFK